MDLELGTRRSNAEDFALFTIVNLVPSVLVAK